MNFKTKDFEEYDQPFLLNKFRKLLDKEYAYGPGDIHYKLFNHLPVSALQTLLDLMNDIWETGELASIWKLANSIPIPKPGKDNFEPSYYLPIAQNSFVGKPWKG